MYLGVPLYRGRTLTVDFNFLDKMVHDRIHSWAKHFLSMGGRVVLVNSVLNSLAIHAMMTLPIPITTLNRIVSMMASFIWDAGSEKRRHWIGWERLCCEKKFGGLGIRNPKDIMLALHGKLAWKYLQNKSLWARHARSRFVVGRDGSPLWNAMSHLIPTMGTMGTWRLGNGDTLCKKIFEQLGGIAPLRVRYDCIRNVMNNPGQFEDFLHALPREEKKNFRSASLSSDRTDTFVWKHSTDGNFSTKIFFESFQTKFGVAGWGDLIWSSSIPTKISCLLWKVFHNVLPTDENVMRLHIPLVSRCHCCKEPKMETTHHLLFQGEWAD